MKNKKIVIGLVALAVLCIGAVVIKTQMDKSASGNQDEAVEKMAEIYYEDFFYDAMTFGKDKEEIDAFFLQYEESGFKLSIESIENVSEIDVSKQSSKLDKDCDKEKNNITITPKAPYGKTDYKVKAVCK